jgi:hypothetical protein
MQERQHGINNHKAKYRCRESLKALRDASVKKKRGDTKTNGGDGRGQHSWIFAATRATLLVYISAPSERKSKQDKSQRNLSTATENVKASFRSSSTSSKPLEENILVLELEKKKCWIKKCLEKK